MQEKPDGISAKEQDLETASIPLTDKILQLKRIEIFGDLSINELAAVASVTKEAAFDEGQRVFIEGERGDTLYLVLDGDVAVIKNCNTEKEIELDSIGAGEYFGEMALFTDDRRSATIRVKTTARFLNLHRRELHAIVSEYPQIALHVCRVLSMRIRRLHAKISGRIC
jgi:CRP-like cAMP-binding protein